MKKLVSSLAVVISIFFSGDSVLQPKSLCHMMPVSIGGPTIAINSGTGLSEQDFLQVLKRFVAINKSVVAQNGFNLILKNKWADVTINSDTYVSGKSWIINAYGGLARSVGMTPDAYMMVLSHELGHHLGGAPTYPAPENWASVEGESDYYAAMKGFRRLADAGALMGNGPTMVPAIVSSNCKAQHQSANEQAICERSSIASIILAEILRKLDQEPRPVSPNLKDPNVVQSTFAGHPHAQCRLDTMLSGSYCGVPYNVNFSPTNASVGACNNGFGSRPLCWYAPNSLPINTPFGHNPFSF